jgi:hypothetical protein
MRFGGNLGGLGKGSEGLGSVTSWDFPCIPDVVVDRPELCRRATLLLPTSWSRGQDIGVSPSGMLIITVVHGSFHRSASRHLRPTLVRQAVSTREDVGMLCWKYPVGSQRKFHSAHNADKVKACAVVPELCEATQPNPPIREEQLGPLTTIFGGTRATVRSPASRQALVMRNGKDDANGCTAANGEDTTLEFFVVPSVPR